MAAEVSIEVSAIVERRRIDHPWAEWSWRPVAVTAGSPPLEDWHVLVADGDVTRFHAGSGKLTLHRKLVEAYRINLARDWPSVWVMLQESEPGSPMPWFLDTVTACPYEAQDLADSGEGILEAVPMPDDIVQWMVAFVRQHPGQEEFKKRRRDRVDVEQLKFGKEPIFQRDGPAGDGQG